MTNVKGMNLNKAWDKLSGLMGEILHAMFLLRDKPGMDHGAHPGRAQPSTLIGNT